MTISKYRSQCHDCDKVTYGSYERATVLTALPPQKGSRTLNEGMRCSAIQECGGFLCDGCNIETTLIRENFIRDAPEVLLIQINRHGEGKKKLATKLLYDENIDVTELLEPYARQTGEMLKYQLYGAICHEGTDTTGGHYTVFVRTPEEGWAHINDDKVSPATLDNALCKDLRGISGRRSMVPYVLIFLRMPVLVADTATKMTSNDSLLEGSLDESTIVPIDRAKQPLEQEKQSPVQLHDDGSDAELAASFQFIDAEDLEVGNSPAIKTTTAPAPPLVTRWEGQPAEIKVSVTMGEMVLTGALRGVLKRTRKSPSSTQSKGSIPPEKPQGIRKRGVVLKSSKSRASLKGTGPAEPAPPPAL